MTVEEVAREIEVFFGPFIGKELEQFTSILRRFGQSIRDEDKAICVEQGKRFDCTDPGHDPRYCSTCDNMSSGAERCEQAIESKKL